jgi:hypothetical protein
MIQNHAMYMRLSLSGEWAISTSSSWVVLNKSVLELTALSVLAATCCVAASSLQMENFPVFFATLSLLTAITALWVYLTTSK